MKSIVWQDLHDGVTRSQVAVVAVNDALANDPHRLLQIGLAVVLDKPIIILAREGCVVPDNVRKVARTVQFHGPGHESKRAALVRGMVAAGFPMSRLQ
jgi:hypothetical protein